MILEQLNIAISNRPRSLTWVGAHMHSGPLGVASREIKHSMLLSLKILGSSRLILSLLAGARH